MKIYAKEELEEILRQHRLWFGANGGERANLREADLRGADFRRADLRGIRIWDSIGNMREIKTIIVEKWVINYTFTHMQIGCENYSITEWLEFHDYAIEKMDSVALDWWHKWKDTIMKIIEMSPAKPTGKED